MKVLFEITITALIFFISVSAQGFDVKATGVQTFSFTDANGRNQGSFHSHAPLEDIDGLTTKVTGKITFNVKDFANTLKGEFQIPVVSLKTGIEKMEEDLRSSDWLNASKYPEITFNITKVTNVQKLAPNKLSADVIGNFSLHGITKEITTKDTVTYLDANEMTRQVMPGDLLGITGSFDIHLSDFKVEYLLIGMRVSNDIKITINLVGSNKLNN